MKSMKFKSLEANLPERISETPTGQTKEELAEYEAEEWKVRLAGMRQDIEERKNYAKKVFRLIAFWIAGIFILLLIDGSKPYGFGLSENIMLAVIGGTTLNILGVFIFVMKYLFDPKRGP